ncbi:MAG: hypothetical protein A2Y10_08525 [Planctomycetes bacterium GWF2_41_51]|nr:MAG: hypothetical protein A2Y10_08525 [Planctomycetes bacterium GWF2_41_51]HBG28578.1 hypothetical protein [Phycisphaerales bacterium]
MSCCNGKIKQELGIIPKVRKLKNIAEGFAKLAVSRTGMDFKYAKERLSICENCENITWLKDAEFAAWLAENKLSVLKNMESLEKLSDLPIKPRRALTRRYCVKCKCNIMAKIHSKEERCPEERW